METNHEYSVGTKSYSGASEIVHAPAWNAGISSATGQQEIKLIRRGSLVTITGFMKIPAAGIAGNTILANIPAEFRPLSTASLVAKTNTPAVGNADVVFNIFSNGDVSNNTDALKDYFFISQSYWVN